MALFPGASDKCTSLCREQEHRRACRIRWSPGATPWTSSCGRWRSYGSPPSRPRAWTRSSGDAMSQPRFRSCQIQHMGNPLCWEAWARQAAAPQGLHTLWATSHAASLPAGAQTAPGQQPCKPLQRRSEQDSPPRVLCLCSCEGRPAPPYRGGQCCSNLFRICRFQHFLQRFRLI